MASDWNLLLERLLAAPLTANEYRLALAISRSTLGYRQRSADLGEQLLRERSRITDGRGFARARDGLIAAGVLRYTPGRGGRGNRSTYELLLDANPRSHAGVSTRRNPRPDSTKTPAPARARIDNGRERTQPTPATSITTTTAEVYLAAGGSLELEEWRGALGRQAAALAKRGTPERTIVAAARDLGRAREFPGYLQRRTAELEQAGGPCSWAGLDRSRLTVAQLGECACALCVEWRAYALTEAVS